MSSMRFRVSRRVAGLCGLAAPPFAFALIFLTIHLNSSWFSWTGNALSDLGDSARSPSHLLFDAGLTGTALLELPLVASLPGRVRGPVGRAGILVLGAGVLSLAGIGLFPESGNGFPGSAGLHVPFSVAFYALTPMGLLLLAVDLLRSKRRWALLSLGCALAAGLIWALPYPGKGVAIPEALSAGLMSGWAMLLGARLFRERAPAGTPPPEKA